MTKISASGLVIREQSIGEADKLITVLTGKYGIVRAFARGSKKTKSKRLSATSLLTYGEFTFSETKDTFSVEDAVAKEVFFELRNDVTKTALAQYICELAYEFCEENYESEETLRLFLNSLYFLKTDKKTTLFVKAVTELRLMCLAGYMPDLVACENCAAYEDETMRFVYETGKIYCRNCVPEGRSTELPLSVIKGMRHIVFSEFDKIYSFSLSPENEKILAAVTEEYLIHKSGRNFKTLAFFKVLGEM